MTARANSRVSDSLSRCSLRPNVRFCDVRRKTARRARTHTCANCRTLYGVGSDFLWFIGKGRHDLVRETTEALPRAAAAQNHVLDASSTQGFELAHDLVWRADQAVRHCFFGRMTIG